MASTHWNDLTARKYLGNYLDTYFGYSLLEEIRANAASGGITSTILIDALREKQIDGALLCRSVIRDNQVSAEFFIAKNEADIRQAQGSKYIAARFAAEALPQIQKFKGKLAVVCLPCEARMLHLLCEKDKSLDKKISLALTLFCGHATSRELTEFVLNKLNPQNKPLKDFRYRVGHWRGNLKLTFEDGDQVVKPFKYFSDYQNLFFFSQYKCLQCSDHTGVYSDISIGDVWSMKMKNNPIKHNAIIIRTEAGRQAIKHLQQSQLAQIFSVPVSKVCAGQSRSLLLHAAVNARAEVARSYGIHINKISDENSSLLEKLTARVVLHNYNISKGKDGLGRIQSIPRFLIKIYLYFFKALQVMQKPKPIKKSIAVMGGSIWGNRGAESMLVTTISFLKEKYPDADFKVFTVYPKKDRSLVQDPKITILGSRPLTLALIHFPFSLLHWIFSRIGIKIWLPASVRQLRDCSIMFDIGGITFAERGMILLYNIFTIWPAMLLSVPVVKLSQAVGPFNAPVNRFFAKIFLNRCARIYPRGEKSFEYLQALGLKSKQPLSIAADIAFLYQPQFSLSSENPEKVSALSARLAQLKRNGKTIIFISPSSVVLKKINSPQYEQLLLDTMLNIDKENFHYIFLPNSNRAGSEKSQNNDLFVLEKIKTLAEAQLAPDLFARIDWIDWDLNTQSIRELFSHANLVITSRFHAMVSSLALEVPVYVIGWSHKYAEVLKMFNLEKHMVDFKDADPAILTKAIQNMLANQAKIKNSIHLNLQAVKQSAKTQFEQENIHFSK